MKLPKYIDPHIHMTSRTTDDYENMRNAGIVAIIEPSFWLGQPRTKPGSYFDYLCSLVGWERFRASQFGISHYCTIGLNAKEANDPRIAEPVMEMLPLFATKEKVVAIGEIGFDDQTPAEEKYFRLQLELAKELSLPIQIHTPHRDKKKGTLLTMDLCEEHGVDPAWVVIDHNNEETVQSVLDRGYWAAFTIYPKTKMGSKRMVEVARQYGSERMMIDSSADWGISDPLAVPKTAKLMLESGISPDHVKNICYQNALLAYGKSGQMNESDFLFDKNRTEESTFEGNRVLRGERSTDDIIE